MIPWRSAHGLTPPELDSMAIALAGAGHRLADVAGCWDGASDRLTATWLQDGVQSSGTWALPIDSYQRVFEQKSRRGLRPDRLSFYPTPSGVHVCVLWVRASAQWEAHHGLDPSTYQETFTRLAEAGFRLLDVSGYEEHGQERYAAVWEHQPGAAPWSARHGIAAADFQAVSDGLGRQGLLPERVGAYTVAGQVRYAGVWSRPTAPAVSVRHGVEAWDYQRVFDDHAYQGYRPAVVRAAATPEGVRYTAVFHHDDLGWKTLTGIDALVDSFRHGYDVPGLSLAITQHGRLVYARARGLADPATSTPLSVRHRMRVASVSKPVTAAAVMLLVQRGQLALTDQVLGDAGLLGTTYGDQPYEADETAITVDHLLTHTAGFRPPDPMFDHPSLDHAALLGWVLDNGTPASTPGTVHSYSNVGYCFLGRVVEHVTGQRYDDYVRQTILVPAGATSMQLAGDTAADRATDEVAYVGQDGEDPYAMKVRRMDAHGGWIATPIDLLRFLRAVDGREGGLDVLDVTHAALMAQVPAGVVDVKTGLPTNYARGCAVSGDSWDHNGSLPGSMAVLRRLPEGLGHAAALNTRRGGDAEGPMLDAVHQLLDEVTTRLSPLPPYDLF